MSRAHGIDISKYQTAFDASVNPEDIHFVVVRATYGIFTDRLYDELVEQIQPVPVRGAYHYFRSNLHWQQQADHFLSVVKDKRFHFYALDIENAYNEPSGKFARGAESWLKYVAEKTGQPVVLYTNPTIYKTWLKPYGDWMTNWPLWLAQYYFEPDRNKQPALPEGVTDWIMWQYSADGNNMGSAYGVQSRHIDLDVFNGTVEDLHKWAAVKGAAARTATTSKKPAEEADPELEALAKKLAPLVAPLVAELLDKSKSRSPRSGARRPVSFGVPGADPGPKLEDVPGIGPEYAKRLSEGGITMLEELASAEVDDVTSVLTVSEERALQFIEAARKLLGS